MHAAALECLDFSSSNQWRAAVPCKAAVRRMAGTGQSGNDVISVIGAIIRQVYNYCVEQRPRAWVKLSSASTVVIHE